MQNPSCNFQLGRLLCFLNLIFPRMSPQFVCCPLCRRSDTNLISPHLLNSHLVPVCFHNSLSCCLSAVISAMWLSPAPPSPVSISTAHYYPVWPSPIQTPFSVSLCASLSAPKGQKRVKKTKKVYFQWASSLFYLYFRRPCTLVKPVTGILLSKLSE